MSYPLLRTRWSNELVQTGVFLASIAYMLPTWYAAPAEIYGFLLSLSVGLLIDVSWNFVRFKRPICGVSAAVTVGILQALTPGLPLWARLAAIVTALVVGKHLQGGTGKNLTNPALTALLALGLLFGLRNPLFPAGPALLPAILLSMPFLIFRPFAGIGMIVGMTAALFSQGSFEIGKLAASGVFFWGCLVITDPVTITPRPLVGAMGGLLAGFVPSFFSAEIWPTATALLGFNFVSYLFDRRAVSIHPILSVHRRWRKAGYDTDAPAIEIGTTTSQAAPVPTDRLSPEEILQRIEEAGVFGCGGGAFSAARKIRAAIAAPAPAKYLIVNAVECDPGLIHDRWLMDASPGGISAGAELVARCFAPARRLLAVKDSIPGFVSDSLEIIRVRDNYPTGAESILCRDILKFDLPEGVFPAEQGILVLNAQTVSAVHEAVSKGRRADSRYLTVADVRQGRYTVARVALGTPVYDVARACLGNSGRIFMGGGIMQARRADETDVVEAGTNFIAVADPPRYKESPLCSRCGFCSAICPTGLRVNAIAERVEAGDFRGAAAYRPELCLSCGSCSRICLAGKDLCSTVSEAKERAREGAL